MKKFISVNFLSSLCIILFTTTSCVHDGDFELPEINSVEPAIIANLDIATVKSIFGGFEPQEIKAGEDSEIPLYIEGYVISSDETGNFYKQLVVQDRNQNPTAGISISTDATDLYTKYGIGRKIYFRVDGLFIGEFAGLLTIGTQNGDEVGRIGVEDFNSRIFRSLELSVLVPQVVTITQALNNEDFLNTLIQFQNAQFIDDLTGNTYGNCDNTFGVNRNIQDCDYNIITLRNSGFVDFSCILLPEGNGNLTAVLSKFNASIQLFIRDTTDVAFTADRCEVEIILGEPVDLPFTEGFEGQTAGIGELITTPGWTNININNGTFSWEAREFNSNQYAQTSALDSDEDPYEVWLITPGVILPTGSTPALTFETKDGFNNGEALTVAVSTNYDGNIATATWTEINATISTGTITGYPDDFTNSGAINLSAYAGSIVNVRFKYQGSSSGITTRYQIDNVSIIDQ